MRPPGFWMAPPGHPAARLLAPLGAVYGRLTAARMDRPGVAAPCPVLCVGNFTLGGAGKTPTAIALAALLRTLGQAPAFLTRGYGGRLPGPIRVDPSLHGAVEVGDESLLLAAHAPTIVARDRVAGARLCAAGGASVVVMDDGLQNPSLIKDLSLAVIDAGAGSGNGRVFPAGPLRAPLDRQWRHVGAIVLVGEGAPGEALAREAAARGLAVHRASLEPEAAEGLRDQAVLAFAGIGRPEKFFDTLRQVGARIVEARPFPDHHRFGAAELAALAAQARGRDARLVTTQKDAVRLPREFAEQVCVLRVSLRFADEEPLRQRLAGLTREPGSR